MTEMRLPMSLMASIACWFQEPAVSMAIDTKTCCCEVQQSLSWRLTLPWRGGIYIIIIIIMTANRAVSIISNLQYLLSSCVQWHLHDTYTEDTVTAAGLGVQSSVCNLPSLLTYLSATVILTYMPRITS